VASPIESAPSTGTLPGTVLWIWQTASGSCGVICVSWLRIRQTASPSPASATFKAFRMRRS